MSAAKDKAFVFVVCGSADHINTLNFSIKALKKFSRYPIIVITDSKRNATSIEHDYIIDVSTPVSYTHHEASIWLKTSLHKILPSNKLYTYLDSDVIALNSNCNNIFTFFDPPITFALDHITASYFSPYAVHCSCIEKHYSDKKDFELAIKKATQHKNFPANYSNPYYRILLRTLHEITLSKTAYFKFLIKLPFSLFKPVKISNEVKVSIHNKEWIISEDYTYPIILLHRKAIRQNGYSFSYQSRQWKKIDEKRLIQANECTHLHEAIRKKFGIIIPANYQHWNGGVFLFDKSSADFMQQWHENTLSIFNDKYWKTRDQATLIVTAFQKGLEHHTTLPENFNFIADFYQTDIYPHPTRPSAFFKKSKIIEPSFIHIYHQWQNDEWDVWQRVLEIVGR